MSEVNNYSMIHKHDNSFKIHFKITFQTIDEMDRATIVHFIYIFK